MNFYDHHWELIWELILEISTPPEIAVAVLDLNSSSWLKNTSRQAYPVGGCHLGVKAVVSLKLWGSYWLYQFKHLLQNSLKSFLVSALLILGWIRAKSKPFSKIFISVSDTLGNLKWKWSQWWKWSPYSLSSLVLQDLDMIWASLMIWYRNKQNSSYLQTVCKDLYSKLWNNAPAKLSLQFISKHALVILFHKIPVSLILNFPNLLYQYSKFGVPAAIIHSFQPFISKKTAKPSKNKTKVNTSSYLWKKLPKLDKELIFVMDNVVNSFFNIACWLPKWHKGMKYKLQPIKENEGNDSEWTRDLAVSRINTNKRPMTLVW